MACVPLHSLSYDTGTSPCSQQWRVEPTRTGDILGTYWASGVCKYSKLKPVLVMFLSQQLERVCGIFKTEQQTVGSFNPVSG